MILFLILPIEGDEKKNFLCPMIYGEIIIGAPGSGKSTYVNFKKDALQDRKIFTVNLDPGNNREDFDYDIKKLSTTKKYMEMKNVGPNYSVKCILRDFYKEYDDFKGIISENENSYFLFDFPGQVEFFMCDGTLRNFCKSLQRDGMYLVVVNLIDIVFFIEWHALLSSYLISTIAMVLLEMPHVCIASKCDRIKDIEIGNLEDILMGVAPLENIKKPFYKSLAEVVDNEGLLSFELLDYENVEAMMYAQMIIDKASGFFFNEDPQYEDLDKERIIDHYLKLSKKAEENN